MDNRFEYQRRDWWTLNGGWRGSIDWQLYYNDVTITGSADTVRQAHRRARKALRRYKRMERKLNGR